MRQLKTKNFTETEDQSRVCASVTDRPTAAAARGRGGTQFGIRNVYWTLTLLSLMTIAAARTVGPRQAARIAAWDCETPATTAVYDAHSFCQEHAPAELQAVQQSMVLAQIVHRHRAHGFKCMATRTTQSHICGAFSYEKALPYLTKTVELAMTTTDCRALRFNGVFRDRDTGHKQSGLNGLGVWHFTAAVRGLEYVEGGDTACQGVTAVVDGQRIDRLVQTAEYSIVVIEETFELTRTTAMALATGERLKCPPRDRGCVGAQHTYSWTMPKMFECPLELIKTAGFTQRDGQIFINQADQTVIELSEAAPTKRGECPGVWRDTQEPRLVVLVNATAVAGIPQVQPEEVDPFLSMAMSRSFNAYWFGQARGRAAAGAGLITCSQQMERLQNGRTVVLDKEEFAQLRGDTVETFTCKPVVVDIRAAKSCHEDIPVEGPQPFASLRTRILKPASPVTPCVREFPTRIRGEDDLWWRIDPAVIREPAPRQWKGKANRPEPGHMDRPAGLYTDLEKEQWATLQAAPVYKEQLYNSLEVGSCGTMESCPLRNEEHQGGGFDLGRIAAEIPGYAWYERLTSPLNWWIAVTSCMILILAVTTAYLLRAHRARQGTTTAGTNVTVNTTTTAAAEPGSRLPPLPFDLALYRGTSETGRTLSSAPTSTC